MHGDDGSQGSAPAVMYSLANRNGFPKSLFLKLTAIRGIDLSTVFFYRVVSEQVGAMGKVHFSSMWVSHVHIPRDQRDVGKDRWTEMEMNMQVPETSA